MPIIPSQDFNNCEIGAQRLLYYPTDFDNPIQVLYQSGYLTIKGNDSEFDILTLGYPNLEVEEGFNKLIKIGANFDDSIRSISGWIVE